MNRCVPLKDATTSDSDRVLIVIPNRATGGVQVSFDGTVERLVKAIRLARRGRSEIAGAVNEG